MRGLNIKHTVSEGDRRAAFKGGAEECETATDLTKTNGDNRAITKTERRHDEPACSHTTDTTRRAHKISTPCRDKKGSREFSDF